MQRIWATHPPEELIENSDMEPNTRVAVYELKEILVFKPSLVPEKAKTKKK